MTAIGSNVLDLSFVALVIAVLVVLAVFKAFGRRRRPQELGYQIRTRFLSPAERSFYGVLCSAVANDYVVFAKVRVADVITPMKSQDRSKWQIAFNRISAKHFDYVLCDPKSLVVELVVELNDRSHKRAKRAERDEFLRGACASAGLHLSEFAAKSSYSISDVRSEILRTQTLGETGEGRVEPHF